MDVHGRNEGGRDRHTIPEVPRGRSVLDKDMARMEDCSFPWCSPAVRRREGLGWRGGVQTPCSLEV